MLYYHDTKPRFVIMAGGGGTRWKNHLGTPKHTIVIEGERLIDRTVRLIRERTDADIVIVSSNPDCGVEGTRRVESTPMVEGDFNDGLVPSVPHWSPTERTIILFGDVYFTDHAMDMIVRSYESSDYWFFGRKDASTITQCPWGETFAIALLPQHQQVFHNAISEVDKVYKLGEISRITGWEVYRKLQDIPLHDHEIKDNFVEINDFTEDFDYPYDYRLWIERFREQFYIQQGMDSCCFVYAVANFQIRRGKPLPDLEQAKDIALCRNGSTIRHDDVVNFFHARLERTDDPKKVLEKSGIINIHHPIWNGHCFLLFPEERGITAINSWLGPLVAKGLGEREILQFVSKQYGSFWVSK
jgi:hypothetical protein